MTTVLDELDRELANAYKRGHNAALREYGRLQRKSALVGVKCQSCGAKDSRDRAHQRGCPKLPPVPKAELLIIAELCERNWSGKTSARKPRQMARNRAQSSQVRLLAER